MVLHEQIGFLSNNYKLVYSLAYLTARFDL